MAHANLAMADSEQREKTLKRMAPLLDEAIRSTEAKVAVRAGDLEKLTGYRGQGTYLGQLNLALASWSLAGGDERYLPLHRHLTEVLASELGRKRGQPIKSFPGYSWTFDTVPALVSISAFDRHSGGERAAPLLKAHREWVRDHGIHPTTGLPWSRMAAKGRGLAAPRGCDLSWRIALLAQVDRGWAEELYGRYTSSFWLDRRMMSGFAEWPEGRRGRTDLDSGPVFQGIGSSASTLGLASVIAMDDRERRDTLEDQLAMRHVALPLLLTRDHRTGRQRIAGMIDHDSQYVTGFLYGDVTLFYSLTWQEWPG